MFDSWGDDVEWWETVAPQDGCTRFRIFYPNEHKVVPRGIVDVMAALGAWRVWAGNAAACGSYNHRERREVHYRWPEGHPVERAAPRAARVALRKPSLRTVAERATSAIGWSSTSRVTCPDWQQKYPTVAASICAASITKSKRGRVPRPDGRLPIDADWLWLTNKSILSPLALVNADSI